MKRFLIVALATCFMLAMGTGLAFADSYDVTADFGKRVTEQGSCEETGAVTITQHVVPGDSFYGMQVITMELLGGLTVCNSFYAVYNFSGAYNAASSTAIPPIAAAANEYSVQGVAGQDFVTVTVGGALGVPPATTAPVIFGHDTYSRLCVNLTGTLYTASDPVYQLLQASYSDSLSNTFSGDQYIATVKSRTVLFSNCDKDEGTLLSVAGYSAWDDKDSLPEICLDFDPSYGAQDQSVIECGDNLGVEQICLEVMDVATGAFPAGSSYRFTIGKTAGAKACVGIANAIVYYMGAPAAGQSITARTRADGTAITLPTILLSDYVDTAQIQIQFTAGGPGSYYIVLTMAFDTCCATPGDYVIDFAGQRVPCGGSFSFSDQTVAIFSTCTVVPPTMITQYNMVCPYGAETATSGWFNGIVVTNPTAAPNTVQFVIYEADGDMYTGSITVPANGLEVDFDDVILSPVSGGTDATFGDEAYAVYANSIDGPFYIFFLNFDGTQAQGYLGIMLPNTLVPAP